MYVVNCCMYQTIASRWLVGCSAVPLFMLFWNLFSCIISICFHLPSCCFQYLHILMRFSCFSFSRFRINNTRIHKFTDEFSNIWFFFSSSCSRWWNKHRTAQNRAGICWESRIIFTNHVCNR